MSQSATMLFKIRESPSGKELKAFIEKLAERRKWDFGVNSEEHDEQKRLKYCSFVLSDVPFSERVFTSSIIFGLADEPYVHRVYIYKWELDQEYFQAIMSEDYYGNGRVLYEFFYELLREYPQAKMYTGPSWFYTLEDFEKMEKRPYDKLWFQNNPTDIE